MSKNVLHVWYIQINNILQNFLKPSDSHFCTSYFAGIVLTDPRTEAEEYQFSNKKFKSDVASSGVSLQDIQLSPVMGFHSMSEAAHEKKKEKNDSPSFDIKTMQRTITAINGKSVELSCSVIDLGNKTVR